MKNLILLSGSIGVMLTLIGTLFTFLHWKGATFIMLLAVVTIAFVFIPSLTYVIGKGYKLVRVKH